MEMGFDNLSLMWKGLFAMSEANDIEGIAVILELFPEILEDIERFSEGVEFPDVETSWQQLKERLIKEGEWVE